jgi:hypothetical protein
MLQRHCWPNSGITQQGADPPSTSSLWSLAKQRLMHEHLCSHPMLHARASAWQSIVP